MFCLSEGNYVHFYHTERQVKTNQFFALNPVFSLDEATKALAPDVRTSAMVDRLKYHLKSGTLRLCTRGVYAVVPAGVASERFQPDPFLVAVAMRPDAVFSHYSAMSLLGVAHNLWHQHCLYTDRRRKPLQLDTTAILFMEHPGPLLNRAMQKLGTRKVEHRGKIMMTTGPERTLVEGFRKPALVGGADSLVTAAAGFSSLDLDLLEEILQRYNIANLWAAIGWFMERFGQTFHVPEAFLERLALKRPRSPQYLERGQRGGKLEARWNLVLPRSLHRMEELDDR